MLARSLSFSRRASRARGDATEQKGSEQPSQTEPSPNLPSHMQPPRPPPQPTRMAKIVRSASFSRRGSKAKGSLEEVAGAKGNEIRTTTEDSSSDSRPLSPDEEPREKEELVARALRREKLEDRPKKLLPPEQMTDDDFAALDLVDNLSGWMSKRHHKKQYQWARRFFIVNDERGTIGYSKGLKGKRARPSVVLSLQDLKSVQRIPRLLVWLAIVMRPLLSFSLPLAFFVQSFALPKPSGRSS